jgi:pimeloyl-ACP methyl ester carboxylesterase
MGARVQRWLIITARGDTVRALWRAAGKKTVRPWTAVLLGGFHTGDKAALLVPDDTLFNMLAVNWPWAGKRRLSPREFALQLPAIQRAVNRSPSILAIGAAAAAQSRGVDPSRIVLVGASLGVPPVLAALRLTSVPAAVVLLDGGADLEGMIRVGLEREGWVSAAAAVSAAGAMQWLWPLEPTLNAPAAVRLPVLLLNSRGDELVPRASVLKLQASLPHATVRWREGGHIRPSQKDVFARLTRDVDAWLRGLEGASRTESARPRASLPDAR